MTTNGDETEVDVAYEEETEDVTTPSVESLTAVRTSPTATAALIAGFLGLFTTPGALQSAVIRFEGGARGIVLEVFSLVVPLALAAMAWWLANEADSEIEASGGKLGGVGFFRAARIASYIIPLVLAAAVITGLFVTGSRSFGS